MLRVLLPMLLLATVLPATAAVDPCDRFDVCHSVVVEDDPLHVCATVRAYQDGAIGPCVYEAGDGRFCVAALLGSRGAYVSTCDHLA